MNEGRTFALRTKGIVSIISNDFQPCIHEGEIKKTKGNYLAFFPYNSKGQTTDRSFHCSNYTFYKTREDAYEAAKQMLLGAVDAEKEKVERYFAAHPAP